MTREIWLCSERTPNSESANHLVILFQQWQSNKLTHPPQSHQMAEFTMNSAIFVQSTLLTVTLYLTDIFTEKNNNKTTSKQTKTPNKPQNPKKPFYN